MKPPGPVPHSGRRAPIRRIALLALVLLAGLGAAHALLWRHMATTLEAGFANWVNLRRAQGWRVEHGPPQRGGWPFSATLGMERLRVEGGDGTIPGGLALAAERVVLRVSLPRLDRLELDLPGQGRLRLGLTEYPFASDRLQVWLPLDGGALPREADAVAERLRIGTPTGALELRLARLTAQGLASATEAEAALRLALNAESIELPAGGPAPVFGRQVAQFSADVAISGPVPPGRAPAPRAEAWREGGGTLELRAVTLRWGPVGAAAAATLALDDALQPMGAGTLKVSGAGPALDALAEAGVIGRRAADAARALLPLLARRNPGGEVELPVTLEDRTLVVARIPVLRLDPWVWPTSER